MKWSNPGKGVAPFPTPQCWSYSKMSFESPLTMVASYYLSYVKMQTDSFLFEP